MNVVLLTGNLGRDPEISHGRGGARCSLRLAVDRSYMSGGTRKEVTEWVDVVVWGKQGETCGKYLSKGRLVQVQGEIRTRSYEHKGQKRTATEVVANKVDFLDRPKGRKPEAPSEVASCDDGRPRERGTEVAKSRTSGGSTPADFARQLRKLLI